MRRRDVLFALAGLFAAWPLRGARALADGWNDWTTPLGRQHPLAGRIWRSGARDFVDPAGVISELKQARFALLGEKHDNPDHHRLQARIVTDLIGLGRRPAVAFEMFSTDQEAALDRHIAAHPIDASGLGQAVSWSKTGWPDWAQYEPIAKAALDAGLPILAANLSQATIRNLARKGFAALEPQRIAALGLDRPLPEAARASARAEIIESHCGQLPDAMVDPMVNVMFARDAFMADVLAQAAHRRGTDGAVLIAGDGHVRVDRGVPWHLARLAPGTVIRSLAFAEVHKSETAPDDYAEAYQADRLPFDYVWFTARLDDLDPCETFADELRATRNRGQPRPAP
ncbi:MAG: ChaN family lipoprotein [Alphaproteobacteria bacterium]